MKEIKNSNSYLAPNGHDFWVLAQVLSAEACAVDDDVEIVADVAECRHSLAPEFSARARDSAKEANVFQSVL